MLRYLILEPVCSHLFGVHFSTRFLFNPEYLYFIQISEVFELLSQIRISIFNIELHRDPFWLSSKLLVQPLFPLLLPWQFNQQFLIFYSFLLSFLFAHVNVPIYQPAVELFLISFPFLLLLFL